ncbi:uncharacterized protein LOC117222062 isoform X3 [Megalopta genalis]|uniref:uncharacterized protein LOC117222062 isoform X3 n=1 Tax=Megalopta genalis TaxID=115081 RepID=UPI003FCF88C6
MAQEIPETTYVPEVAKDARKERERRTVQDGTALWKRRKEELERRKHREQRELQQILENYSPWGKPGGGAPCAATLRKKNVPLEPIEAIESLVRPESLEQGRCRNFGQGWTSDATIERIHRKHINPMDVTDTNRFFDDKGTMSGVASGMPPVEEPMRRYNDEVQVYELTGGVELVPLLTSRRYYSQQPQSTRYVATDATRPGYTIEPFCRSKNGRWNRVLFAGTLLCRIDPFSVVYDRCIERSRSFEGKLRRNEQRAPGFPSKLEGNHRIGFAMFEITKTGDRESRVHRRARRANATETGARIGGTTDGTRELSQALRHLEEALGSAGSWRPHGSCPS